MYRVRKGDKRDLCRDLRVYIKELPRVIGDSPETREIVEKLKEIYRKKCGELR